jgi:chorismate mutase
MSREKLEDCRIRIDALDLELLELLNRRTRIVEEIGQIKQILDLPIYEPRREDDVYRNIAQNNRGPLSEEALKSIFERIIDEMRSLQKMRRRQHGISPQGDKEC